MADHEDLLNSFQPRLRYDSQEAFFADSPKVMAEAEDHVLRRAPKADGSPGELIATAGPGEADLNLGFLRPEGVDYPVGGAALKDDMIQDPSLDLRTEANRLHKHADWGNVIFGAVRSEPESGREWLQYWFFYLYNDYNLAGGYGLHQGDWEMIQLRLAKPGSPDRIDQAVYAQHKYGEARRWEDVETQDGTHPVVYVGRGSHASYFESGLHKTEVWWDIADGEREPRSVRLEILPKDPPSWVLWPGRWGCTLPHRGGLSHHIEGLDQPSPDGPGTHAQWNDPSRVPLKGHEKGALPPAPKMRVKRSHRRLKVDFDFTEQPADVDPPERLMLTVNPTGVASVMPATDTLVIDRAVSGRVLSRRLLNPEWPYDIRVSTQDTAGMPTAGPEVSLRPVPQLKRRLLDALQRLSRLRHRAR